MITLQMLLVLSGLLFAIARCDAVPAEAAGVASVLVAKVTA